jgi:hypothetical protein
MNQGRDIIKKRHGAIDPCRLQIESEGFLPLLIGEVIPCKIGTNATIYPYMSIHCMFVGTDQDGKGHRGTDDLGKTQ